jgi:hypothetical protein
MDPLTKVPRICGGQGVISDADGEHGSVSVQRSAAKPDILDALQTIMMGSPDQQCAALKCMCEALSCPARSWGVGMAQLREVMPVLVRLAPDASMPHETRLNALWALTNIAAGASEFTYLLLEYGALSVLVYILRQDSQDLLLVEQAAWALGNVSGDSGAARDAVLAAGALQLLVQAVQNSLHATDERNNLLKIVTWAISNNFHGTPRPAIKASETLPVMLSCLVRSADAEVLSHVCWTVSHICEGSAVDISVALEFDPLPPLVRMLQHQSWRVLKPALRAVGNIVCAEDDGKQKLTQVVVDSGAVQCLRELVEHPSRYVATHTQGTLRKLSSPPSPCTETFRRRHAGH